MGKLYYMSIQKENLLSLGGPGSTSERFQVSKGLVSFTYLSALRPALISNYYQLVGYERRQYPSYNLVSYI